MRGKKLPLVTAVKDKIAVREFGLESFSHADREYRKDILDQFRQAYIQKHVHGCVPNEWIGDDLMGAVIRKFRYVLQTVIEEAIAQTNIPEHLLVAVVEPSDAEVTEAAILYDPYGLAGDKRALCWFGARKAWRYCWQTEADMEKEMRGMVAEVVKAIREVSESREIPEILGARCPTCNGYMRAVDGCSPHPIYLEGKRYERIPYGQETHIDTSGLGDRCPDCGCKRGHYHHEGCDMEECPICHRQMLSCSCDFTWYEREIKRYSEAEARGKK